MKRLVFVPQTVKRAEGGGRRSAGRGWRADVNIFPTRKSIETNYMGISHIGHPPQHNWLRSARLAIDEHMLTLRWNRPSINNEHSARPKLALPGETAQRDTKHFFDQLASILFICIDKRIRNGDIPVNNLFGYEINKALVANALDMHSTHTHKYFEKDGFC